MGPERRPGALRRGPRVPGPARGAGRDFAAVTYSEAVELLQGSGQKFEFPVEWGLDLQSEHERWLAETAFWGTPVFVTDYPKDIKAFYMRLNEDGKTVAAMDLSCPASASSSAGASARSAWTCWRAGCRRRASTWRRTSGTSTCGGTGRSPTRASGWASRGSSSTARGWTTSATRSPSPGTRATRASEELAQGPRARARCSYRLSAGLTHQKYILFSSSNRAPPPRAGKGDPRGETPGVPVFIRHPPCTHFTPTSRNR